MVLSQKIISKHIIKPSIPTPNNFKTHKLSNLDQIAPPIYVPFLFFYQNDESKPQIEISQMLKKSLSQVLTDFYPFAGIIKENSFVDCNDTGVEFTEVQVNARLEYVIKYPEMEDFSQLFAKDTLRHSDNDILLVRVSFFNCGGIGVSICLSHKLADVASLIEFMNAWAATCIGEPKTIKPLFDSAVHFPPRDITPQCFLPNNEKITWKRLVFDKEKLKKLQQEAISVDLQNPSRVEALSIFFWQQFIQIIKGISGMERSSFAIEHSVNLRPRMIPPIPAHSIGSSSIACFAFADESTNTNDLIQKLRVSTKAVDDNYIKKFVNSEEYLRMIYKVGELFNSSTEVLCFSSLWRIPMYDVNFGWGKPDWVCLGNMPYKNHVFFMSIPSGDGIEACINMPEDFYQVIKANYYKRFN